MNCDLSPWTHMNVIGLVCNSTAQRQAFGVVKLPVDSAINPTLSGLSRSLRKAVPVTGDSGQVVRPSLRIGRSSPEGNIVPSEIQCQDSRTGGAECAVPGNVPWKWWRRNQWCPVSIHRQVSPGEAMFPDSGRKWLYAYFASQAAIAASACAMLSRAKRRAF